MISSKAVAKERVRMRSRRFLDPPLSDCFPLEERTRAILPSQLLKAGKLYPNKLEAVKRIRSKLHQLKQHIRKEDVSVNSLSSLYRGSSAILEYNEENMNPYVCQRIRYSSGPYRNGGAWRGATSTAMELSQSVNRWMILGVALLTWYQTWPFPLEDSKLSTSNSFLLESTFSERRLEPCWGYIG